MADRLNELQSTGGDGEASPTASGSVTPVRGTDHIVRAPRLTDKLTRCRRVPSKRTRPCFAIPMSCVRIQRARLIVAARSSASSERRGHRPVAEGAMLSLCSVDYAGCKHAADVIFCPRRVSADPLRATSRSASSGPTRRPPSSAARDRRATRRPRSPTPSTRPCRTTPRQVRPIPHRRPR